MFTGTTPPVDRSKTPQDRAPHLSSRRKQLMTIFDDNGLEVIEPDECLRILSEVSVARVGATSGALPVVVPVNITVTTLDPRRGPEVVLRCVAGSKLSAALRDAVIAVQADAIDPMSHAGWSVLVRGTTRTIDDPSERARALRLPLQPWAAPEAECFIAVSTEVVTGRRIVPWNRGPSGHHAS